MGPVAEGAVCRRLAATKGDAAGLLRGELQRRDLGTCVAAIAERLRTGAAATTPKVVLAFFQFDFRGGFSGDDRDCLGHCTILLHVVGLKVRF